MDIKHVTVGEVLGALLPASHGRGTPPYSPRRGARSESFEHKGPGYGCHGWVLLRTGCSGKRVVWMSQAFAETRCVRCKGSARGCIHSFKKESKSLNMGVYHDVFY